MQVTASATLQPRGHRETMRHAESALTRIGTFKLPADPPSFELWYAHAAGDDPALRKAVDEALEHGADLPAFDRIHRRFFPSAATAEQAGRIGDSVADQVDKVAGLIEAVAGTARTFSDNLIDAQADLARATDCGLIASVVKRLLAAAREAEQQNLDLHESLREARGQVNELQASLASVCAESLTDALTRIANRKHFDQALKAAISHGRSDREPLCLLLCDVDHFKRFNDGFGHQMGDHVLRLIASTLRQSVRGEDLVARYGGEEFAVILPRTPSRQAIAVAESIRAAVSCKPLINRASGASLGKITISIGIAELHGMDNPQSLIERADSCLYIAKETGRNKVVYVSMREGDEADWHVSPEEEQQTAAAAG